MVLMGVIVPVAVRRNKFGSADEQSPGVDTAWSIAMSVATSLARLRELAMALPRRGCDWAERPRFDPPAPSHAVATLERTGWGASSSLLTWSNAATCRASCRARQ